jgi:fused signal recognition particle receptor
MSSGDLLLYVGLAVLGLLITVGAVVALRRRGRELPKAPPEGPGLEAPEKPAGELPAGKPTPALPAPSAREAAYRKGLEKTRGGFIAKIGNLLGKKQIDASLLEQLEEILFTADIGAKTSAKLFEAVRQSLSRDELKDADAVWKVIRDESEQILSGASSQAGAVDVARAKPFVVLMIGVNGVGKTTTIGKLAAKWVAEGKKVLLAAGDTFRAAAAEQLEVWGQRAGVPVVRGKEGADPSSVIFDAAKRAEAEGFDILIADTAGRLHTKTNLMDELQKVRRVVQKAIPSAPHETFLVLDATNGQNAIQQASMFKQAMDVTGIILTKLDGTAKGGVILGICDELKVPVRFVGVGETVDDLREFDAKDFVAALYDTAEAA